MSDVTEADSIRTEIRALRSDLTGAITIGVQSLNDSVNQLAEEHHRGLLEQTKLNVTFAPRDRLDLIAERVNDHTNRIATIEAGHLDLKTTLVAISAQLTAITVQLTSLAERTLSPDHLDWVKAARQRSLDHAETKSQLFKQVIGYLLVAICGIIITGIGLGHIVTTVLGGK